MYFQKKVHREMLRFNIRYEYTIDPVAPPRLTGPLPDQSFPIGAGWRSFDTSIFFSGTGLDYAVIADDGTARIDAVTGEIRLNTATLLDRHDIAVRATNAAGYAEGRFRLTVYPVGVGYWKISDNFIVS